jgi:hypothetical protein
VSIEDKTMNITINAPKAINEGFESLTIVLDKFWQRVLEGEISDNERSLKRMQKRTIHILKVDDFDENDIFAKRIFLVKCQENYHSIMLTIDMINYSLFNKYNIDFAGDVLEPFIEDISIDELTRMSKDEIQTLALSFTVQSAKAFHQILDNVLLTFKKLNEIDENRSIIKKTKNFFVGLFQKKEKSDGKP